MYTHRKTVKNRKTSLQITEILSEAYYLISCCLYFKGCRPECVLSSDCPADKACIRNKCKDPCPGVCGLNAECSPVNHVPTCICANGYTGDPFTACQLFREEPVTDLPIDVCRPSPCGPNSRCHEVNGVAVCSCEDEYIGSPPNCKPECTVNAECPQNKACHKFKCANPCAGTCGVGADCQVINHNPICSCPPNLIGDPFVRCSLPPRDEPPPERINPCVPSPCGLYGKFYFTSLFITEKNAFAPFFMSVRGIEK